MAHWEMLTFQDSNSFLNDNLMSFHNLTLMIMGMIMTFTMLLMYDVSMNEFLNRYLLKHHLIEMFWTIIPICILIFICFPSLKILYLIDEIMNPYFTIKAIGHQWYWSYEYPDFKNIEFDSYLIPLTEKINHFRLLDVDNRIVIPIKTIIRLISSSTDVIHSWTIPCLGIKIDSTPGRINQANLHCFRPGIFYGQCSEICGVNHSFMPIALESTMMLNFIDWILMKLNN